MLRKILIILLVLFPLNVFASGNPERSDTNIIGQFVQVGENGNKSISEILYEIGNIYSYLNKNFLYDIDNKDVEEKLITALADSLGDKYSYYIPSSEADEYEENLLGEYVGIGTYLMKMNPAFIDMEDPRTYMIIITSTFPGGPAERAGLRANDLISHINGEDVSTLDARTASRMLRGKENEELTLLVHRGNSEFEIKLTPEHVTVPTCNYGMLGNIGYLQILSFAENTNTTVENALKELSDKNISALIIDLRNNGGGTVDSALRIADMFLSDGVLLNVQYKESSNRNGITYVAESPVVLNENIPVVILTNEGTASSSEILTASLMDNDRATVIGGKTFGKGIMQNVVPIGDGFLQFTSAHYLTPDGNDIHEKGSAQGLFLYAFWQQKQKIWECLSDLTEKTQSVLFTVVFYCNKIRYRLKNIVLCRRRDRKEGCVMYSHTARRQQPVSTKSLCMTAVCMAVVFMMTFMPRIPIPFGYAHLGDAVIFLLILFLPRRQAGFAASIGSAFSDLLGGFPIWILPTLVIKWVMVEIVFRMAAIPAAGERPSVLSMRMLLAFSVSALWMVIAYAGSGALLYGSAGAGLLMTPGLIGEGVINVAAAMAVGAALQKAAACF